jgi:radical SAM superfamily enzyme YgiQ (UPF0313 family)
MRILLIQPCPGLKGFGTKSLPFYNRLTIKLHMLCPPLTFCMLAAVTPKKHIIDLVDERHQKLNYKKNYDLVGITAMTNEAVRAYDLADEFRKRKIPVVLGGPHVTALPDEAKKHADSVVIGEAEVSWPILLNDLENNELKPFYEQKTPSNLKNIPSPKRNIIERCIIENALQTSRGCPNACKYCFIGNSRDGKLFRKRPIEDVIQEIKKIPQKLIMFYDSSLTIDLKHTKKMFKEMKGLNKKLICLGNINILQKDDELLRLSKEAGCIQWNIGFESVSQESLNEVKKKTNQVEIYFDAIDKIHSYGMNVHGFFIFGFDHDTKEIFDNTWNFIRNTKIDSADFSILTPLPGTPLFDELEQQGRIKTKDWAKYGYSKDLVFNAKNISEKEIIDGYWKIYEKYYSWNEIITRFSNLIKNGINRQKLFIFLIDNILSRSYHLKYLKN